MHACVGACVRACTRVCVCVVCVCACVYTYVSTNVCIQQYTYTRTHFLSAKIKVSCAVDQCNQCPIHVDCVKMYVFICVIL